MHNVCSSSPIIEGISQLHRWETTVTGQDGDFHKTNYGAIDCGFITQIYATHMLLTHCLNWIHLIVYPIGIIQEMIDESTNV